MNPIHFILICKNNLISRFKGASIDLCRTNYLSMNFAQIIATINSDYDNPQAVFRELVRNVLNNKVRADELDYSLDEADLALIRGQIERFNQGEPLQYITGKAYFYRYEFEVNEDTLIPRPETEELVDMVIEENRQKSGLRILEIGTGSGCIPISLFLNLEGASITSLDISAKAIEVAQRNADILNAHIDFVVFDFLDASRWGELGEFDLIVSNPPYIPRSRSHDMEEHVKSYEPSIALFVEDDDAFLFYKKTLDFARTHLKQGGMVYFETSQYEQLEQYDGFILSSLKDMSGNLRFLKAGLG